MVQDKVQLLLKTTLVPYINLKEMQNISKELIPQIGLNLKTREKGSQCREIFERKYDKELTSLCKKIKNLRNPTFLRIGYEFKNPLIICESSAARVGILKGEDCWNEWFDPYFKWIKNHNNVKAFCYINYNWGIDWKNPGWGNCRIEENKVVKSKYYLELKDKKYVNNMKIKDFLRLTYN